MVKKSSIKGILELSDFRTTELDKISFFYLEKSIALFKDKGTYITTNDGKWKEFVYCILAGSQFPVKKLKIIFPILFSEFIGLFKIDSFKLSNRTLKRDEIANVLKKLGYRYHTQKATTIVSTALYFNENNSGKIKEFLDANSDIDIVRKILVKDIKGIGIKITSHWLRNIGMPVCTVDVHLRRLLFNLGLSSENPEGALKDNDFLFLESIFREWAVRLNVNLGVLQFSIWEYTRDFCAPLNCGECALLDKCKRGTIFKKQGKDLRLF